FVNPTTIVLCRESDPKDANYRALEENRERLEGMRLEDGSKPEVAFLPMPAALHFENRRLPASYANFYVANAAVLVPTFNDPQDRVGVPWLGWTCGECAYCRASRENLCDKATFTGYNLDGGYAEFAVANAAFAFPLPEGLGDTETAPLLCAGMIGYRALVATGPAE